MTKILTAIAIMQLQEHGKINIDDPVIKYLAWFSSTDQKNDLSAITIRQLLRHTSGLPDTIPAMIGWVHFEDEIYNQTEYLKRVMPKYGYLRFKPDKRAAYTNFGYLILGVIIEAVTGQSYDEYVLENILKQAGMDDSNFLYTPKMSDFEAYGSHPLKSIYTPMLPFLLDFKKLVEKWKGKTIWFKRLYHDVLPSSGLIGSPDDAAKFILTYMNSNKLLSESKKKLYAGNWFATSRKTTWLGRIFTWG